MSGVDDCFTTGTVGGGDGGRVERVSRETRGVGGDGEQVEGVARDLKGE